MKLNFCGKIDELREGINIIKGVLGFDVGEGGILVHVEQLGEDRIEVGKKGNEAFIKYGKKVYFFRALGLLLEAAIEKSDFEITENARFTMNGVMVDIAQNCSAITPEAFKKLINRMAVMGLDMFMIYTEDNYEIKGEPYFGYMRGRYSREELKECDLYADIFGIEMIPCIQTLAHLYDALKWRAYEDIRDDYDTMLVGCDKTYELIEKMIAQSASTFKTKRIHIGMDEAWNLGLGRYLNKNGYEPKFNVMNKHLKKVLEITRHYGLKPIIWSDMYFRAGSKNGDYYDRECSIPKSVIDDMPKDVQFAYWDYYHRDEDFYIDWIRRHKEFGSNPIFAGGIWNWYGFGTNYHLTMDTTNPALMACKKEGIREVFVTLWGDNGTENIVFENMLGMQLYAEHGFSDTVDTEKLKKRFEFCTGARYDDFMSIGKLDEVPGVRQRNPDMSNPCQYLLWQDILTGMFDKNIEGHPLREHYDKLTAEFKKCAGRNGEYNYIFELLAKVSDVLAIKSEIGLKIMHAYKSGDRDQLKCIAEKDLVELAERVRRLHECHRDVWHKVHQPFGWEIMDIRYGGVLMRIEDAIYRINGYLEGRIGGIEELDRERLYFTGKPCIPSWNVYTRISSASRQSYLV